MAIAYVQDTGSIITTGTTAAATFGTNPVVGNTVFCSAAHNSGGSAATSYSLADTQSNSWAVDTSLNSSGDSTNRAIVIGRANVTSTGASFKITLTQNGGGSVNLSSTLTTYEFSGIASSSPFDSAGSATATDSGTTRTSPLNATGGTPAGGNELALMVYLWTSSTVSATSLTPSSGFTQNASNLTASTTKTVAGLAYNVISNVSGAQTFGYTVAPTTGFSSSSKGAVGFNLYTASVASLPPGTNNFPQVFSTGAEYLGDGSTSYQFNQNLYPGGSTVMPPRVVC